MVKANKHQVIDFLEQGWGNYVAQFQAMSSVEQAAYLKKQGYARLADLLGHVIAWWERCQQVIQKTMEDPDYQPSKIDVDDFNAAAMKRFGTFREEAVIEEFEAQRKTMLAQATSLPDEAFKNEKIADRFSIEVIEHLWEHNIN
jgi:hypothetical protein